MKLYTFGKDGNDDLLLVSWWLRMRKDGDLERTFLPSAHPLTGFLSIFRESDLMMELDEEGPTACMWLTYMMGAAMTGLWIRSDKRHSVATVRAVLKMYQHVFDAGIGSIVGITKQEALLEEHERLGYEVLGKVPGLWQCGTDGYVVVLTAQRFRERWPRLDASPEVLLTAGGTH